MTKEEQSAGHPPSEGAEQEARPEGTHGIGALLQASRLRCGEDLRYVSDMLHIRYLYLEAIEDDRFEDLPGPTYTIGFIRAYADHLGLDSDEVVRRLKDETSGSNGKLELDFPVPIPESVVPGGAILLVGIFIAILAYGGWYISSSNDLAVSELVSPVPDRFSTDRPVLPNSKDVEPVTPAAPASSVVAKAEEKTALISSSASPAAASPPEPVSPEKNEAPKPDVSAAQTVSVNDVSGAAAATESAAAKTESAAASTESVAASTESAAAATESKTNDKVNGHADANDGNASGPGNTSSSQAEPNKESTTAEVAAVTEKKPVVAEPITEPHANAVEDSAPSSSQASGDGSSSAPGDAAAVETTADIAATALPVGRTYGLENEGSRITVRAKSDSWIQVRDDIANQLLLTRLLRRGDSYRVPNRSGLKLLTGNAGALDILIDGEAVPSIGATGVVRRGVALDVESLRQGTAVIE